MPIDHNVLYDDLASRTSVAFTRSCVCLSALTMLVWDSVTTFKYEYAHIWRGERNVVKCIFLFARYFGICTQLTNCIWVFKGPLAQPHATLWACKTWLVFHLLTFLPVLLALDFILALRIFALYHKNTKMGVSLLTLLVSSFCLYVLFTWRGMRIIALDPSCISYDAPREIAYYALTIAVIHATFLVLTVYRRNTAFRDGWGRNPVVHLMMRDGAWIFVMIISMIAIDIPYVFTVAVAPHLTFPITTSILAVIICRLILNMQRLKTPPTQSVPELTTNITVSYIESIS